MTRRSSLLAARIHAGSQGFGAIVLAYYSWVTRGDGGGELMFNEFWPILLAMGGVVGVTQIFGHTEKTWPLAPALIVAASLGRALDIAFSDERFAGRPQLAIAVWTVIALGTLTSWALVGALVGVFDRSDE